MHKVCWWLLAATAVVLLTPRRPPQERVAPQPARTEPLGRQLTRGLIALGSPETRAGTVAASVARHAAATGLDPALVLAVIAVENRDLRPRSTSSVGATGIMQVMPRWFRVWRRRCAGDPMSVETNICVGTRVLQLHLAEASGSLRRGLLAYNGCRGGDHCRHYPDRVLRRQRRAQIAMVTP